MAARHSHPNKLCFSLGNTWFQNHKTARWASQGILDFWLTLRSTHVVLSILQNYFLYEGNKNKTLSIKKSTALIEKCIHFTRRTRKSLLHSAFWLIMYQIASKSTFSKSPSISFRVVFFLPSLFLTFNRENQFTILSGPNLVNKGWRKGNLKSVSNQPYQKATQKNQPIKQRQEKRQWHWTCFYYFHNINPNSSSENSNDAILTVMMLLSHNNTSIFSYLDI